MSIATTPSQRATAPFFLRDAFPLQKAVSLLLNQQSEEGYWWYTLEANETIGAGFIQLMNFIGAVDPEIQEGLARRILSQQKADGSWAVFYGGPSDLSSTIECYFSLRLAGRPPEDRALIKARSFIVANGGLTKMRI